MPTCFDYPFDAGTLLRKKRKLKRELTEALRNPLQKKVAVLGGSTTNEVVDQLNLFLLHHGIQAEFYQSEYAQYWEDAMFGEELAAFRPDVIYIHTNWRNITAWPAVTDDKEQVETKLKEQYQHFSRMWDTLAAKYGCPIIQNNFDRPNYRLLGNRDVSDFRGRANFVERLNQKLYSYSQSHENFFVNDLDYLAGDYGYSNWNDGLFWNMYKYAMPLEAIPGVAASVANLIKAIYGKNKKALVLDLDNTLWGGVVGDDGVEGIAIGPEVPSGQVYAEFQSYLKAHMDLGVLLAVNSKNDEENALAGLNHPDGILKPEDFVAIRANWENKDRNLVDIAKALNLGVDSFVFVDDNPAERAIVEAQVPGVGVPTMERVEDYIKVLDHSGYFEVIALSSDDLKRTEMYKANAARAAQEASFGDYGEYLDSLEMVAEIRDFDAIHMQRIAQLTNKSNQFNLTTLRCSEADITRMAQDKNWVTLYGSLQDRFGDNGVVSVVAGQQEGNVLYLRLWLMSCRVLKRGMEDAMMDTLMTIAKARGVETVVGYYYPTPKNRMVEEFYGRMGFTLTNTEETGTTWVQLVSEYQPKQPHMLIRAEG